MYGMYRPPDDSLHSSNIWYDTISNFCSEQAKYEEGPYAQAHSHPLATDLHRTGVVSSNRWSPVTE